MSIKVIIPQIGQSIAEATILKWFKQPGESVEKGEPLVEIGTDKINTEIPAPESGVVEKLLVAEGETVPVETEIAVISSAGGSPAEEDRGRDARATTISSTGGQDVRAPGAGSDRYSPAVRRLAAEHKIDLGAVNGTGAGGRVTKEDVLNFVGTKAEKSKRVPMSRMRKLIAQHMLHSKRTTAELTTFFEIDMTEVAARREEAKESFQKENLKLTYLPFVVSAVCRGIRAFPVLNSSIENDDLLYKEEVNIGIAVATEDGLLVPVIHNADQKSVRELARAAQDLAERSRSKRLTALDLEGGTFTITNPGVFGAIMGTPIIHQPQVAILGVGAVVKRPVVIKDAIEIRSMAYFSLTYDHRAMDGSTADGFLAHVKNILEKECPSAL